MQKNKLSLARKMAAGSAALLSLALMPAIAGAQELSDLKSSPPLTLKGEGSFFVGGSTHVVDPKYISPSTFSADSGNSMINQMYVQYQIPQNTIDQYPIVFVHGCCLTSKTWETTPDGRMGWYEYFTRRGFKTYMGEQVGRGRSGFDALQYQKVLTGDLPGSNNPAILIATDKFAWERVPLGRLRSKTPFKDERFPMQTVGVGTNSTLTFYKQVIELDVERSLFADLRRRQLHTLGSQRTFQLTRQHGVACEPTGRCHSGWSLAIEWLPNDGRVETRFDGRQRNHSARNGLFLQSDRREHQGPQEHPDLDYGGRSLHHAAAIGSCVTMQKQIKDAGGDMSFVALPDLGIHGNSHMFMQDNNNLQIADIIINWINKHVKVRGHGQG